MKMREVRVVCEGATEETFVRDVLRPAFLPLHLSLIGGQIPTSKGQKGGALSYDRVKLHLRNTLRQKGDSVVTTLFDLYQLDSRFPGYSESKKQNALDLRLGVLTDAFHKDIVKHAECRPERFIPYIQPHEFEALLFSDVDTLVSVEAGWNHAGPALRKILAAAESPEHINNHENTKPAAHLERELKNPGYRKTRHGPIAAARIGLDRMEIECQFFAEWLAKLRALAPSR